MTFCFMKTKSYLLTSILYPSAVGFDFIFDFLQTMATEKTKKVKRLTLFLEIVIYVAIAVSFALIMTN